MANRYLRATGNWSGAVWAATSTGTAGSAATPTASDDVWIDQNYTLTLNQDGSCQSVNHTNGTIKLQSYNLSVGGASSTGFQSTGTTTRAIDMGNGTLNISFGVGEFDDFILSGSGLTLTAGNSSLVLSLANYSRQFSTNGLTFNEVAINLGDNSTTNSTALSITGAPTFHTLLIQATNSAAQTVTFGGDVTIKGSLIAIGSSTTNRLTLGDGTVKNIQFGALGDPITQTSYGQFVNARVYASGNAIPKYIGSNSIQDTGMGWLIQDPPKMSTLSDALTVAPGSNTNFTITGSVTTRTDGFGGGGYHFPSSSTLVSKGTYDLVGSKFVFERPIVAPGTSGDAYFGVGETFYPQAFNIALWAYTSYDPAVSAYDDQFKASRYSTSGASGGAFNYPITAPKFIRFELQTTGYFSLGHSTDANTWITIVDGFLNATEMLFMRSARIHGEFNTDSYIGSIGMLPAVASSTSNFLPFFV